MTAALLLASTSPRRVQLLREAGVVCDTTDPGVDDAAEATLVAGALRAGRSPASVVLRLATAKLLAALRQPAAAAARPVLAADTVIACDGELLGKAAGAADARATLQRLRARAHDVLTGVALRGADGRFRCLVEASRVRFAAFEEDALEAYLASGLWRGKAGAYGIQDPEAAPLVAEVEGSEANVRGLPTERVLDLLGEAVAG